MKKVLFEETIENPLAKQTDWVEHDYLTVGVHRQYGFNNTRVRGLVEIIQHEAQYEDEIEDFRDIDGESSIITTAEGARRLAAILLKAADAAEVE